MATLDPINTAVDTPVTAANKTTSNEALLNAEVGLNTADRHVAVTTTNTSNIDLTLAGQNITADLTDTGVTPGVQGNTGFTVDAKGRITSFTAPITSSWFGQNQATLTADGLVSFNELINNDATTFNFNGTDTVTINSAGVYKLTVDIQTSNLDNDTATVETRINGVTVRTIEHFYDNDETDTQRISLSMNHMYQATAGDTLQIFFDEAGSVNLEEVYLSVVKLA